MCKGQSAWRFSRISAQSHGRETNIMFVTTVPFKLESANMVHEMKNLNKTKVQSTLSFLCFLALHASVPGFPNVMCSDFVFEFVGATWPESIVFHIKPTLNSKKGLGVLKKHELGMEF